MDSKGERSSGRDAALRSAVIHLAMPGKQVLVELPAGPHRPDRLALRFDEAYTAFVMAFAELPSEPQLVALQALDGELNAISSPDEQGLWTEDAFVNHPRWEQIRVLAREVVAAFDW